MEKSPKIELPPKSQEPEIETWEDEGGNIEPKKQQLTRAEKRLQQLGRLSLAKKQKMESLHRSIQNLDNGEPVDEFRDETRRIIFFDENTGQYFTGENGNKKYLGTGDILSDYAWDIKYVPDGEMTESAYRTVAKRILVNEVRRDIESIYDKELAKTTKSGLRLSIKQPLSFIEKKWETWRDKPESVAWLGIIAETAVRELFNITALNNNLDFVVQRANAEEDNVYKIDFKIRVYQRNRGIRVKQKQFKGGDNVGIQFGLVNPRMARKKSKIIDQIKEKFGKELPVEDILVITIQTNEFREVFDRWLDNKPSGGPEQFLSRDLKIKLLEAATKSLVEISDEEIEKIFPKESPEE